MYNLTIFIILIIQTSCFYNDEVQQADTLSQEKNYSTILKNIEVKRLECKVDTDSASLKLLSSHLLTTLVDSIFPEWYGTPWDFNGTTNEPQKGEIACGYFVTTTLKHAGFNLDRFKLAQQPASIIIQAICGKQHMQRFTSIEKMINSLMNAADGLYIVGLDYHVGYLLVQNSSIYFIHADYVSDKVSREKAENSPALNASNLFVIGNITNNKELMKKWVQAERLY